MNGAGKTTVAEGSQVTSGNKTDLEAAVEVAKKADVVVSADALIFLCVSSLPPSLSPPPSLFSSYVQPSSLDLISPLVDLAPSTTHSCPGQILLMGIDQHVESESHDRDSIDLPSCQHDLAKAITDLKKPTVLVLVNGGMVAIAEEKETVNAILETGYPGIRGSEAIARTIFGDNDHLGGAVGGRGGLKKKKIVLPYSASKGTSDGQHALCCRRFSNVALDLPQFCSSQSITLTTVDFQNPNPKPKTHQASCPTPFTTRTTSPR